MKEYRQNAHVRSLVVWAVLCVVVAVILFDPSGKYLERELRWVEIVGGVLLLIVGPVGLAVYLIRVETHWVSVDSERGILVRGKRLIPWDEIVRIDRRRPRLRSSTGSAKIPEFKFPFGEDEQGEGTTTGSGNSGCGNGCVPSEAGLLLLAIIIILLALLLAIWLIFFVFIPLVIVPVIEVFSPWGSRVTIVRRKWKHNLLLLNLRDPDGFLAEIDSRVAINHIKK
jgi:hypothetical protein